MVTQYPHIIEISVASESTKDVSGNWVNGTPTTSQVNGRYEPNKGNGMVRAADGTMINYEGIVYLPLPQSDLPVGTDVTVKNGETVLLKNTVKQFSKGQLNARVWL